MDFGRSGPLLGNLDEMILQASKIAIKPVGCRSLEQAAKAFHRVEFRAIGWERQKPDVSWQSLVTRAQVKTCLVGNDHMQ